MHSLLHNLIGQHITHDNKLCTLIEVINSTTIDFKATQIQHDQHGSAHRRSMPTFTIHCLNEFKTDLHPVLKTLLNKAEQKRLLQQLL